MKKINKNSWKRAWVIARWDNTKNKIEYMSVGYSNRPIWSTDLINSAYVEDGAKANEIVETNTLKTWTKVNPKIIPPEYRKRYQLFACKVFRNEYNGDYKLTKQTAFHLMEIVANNI